MSEIKVNSIKGVGASTAAITVDNTAGTCTANITNNLSNRNLIINGAMQVAQRGTSSTTSGINSVDRFTCEFSGTDEAPTQAQVDVTSGTTPYTSGFRKAFKVTNGNQTSGAGAADYINLQTKLEAQDIANSGWNYLSSSSSITLSFWVKSSVAQNFYGFLRTRDGTEQNYPFETGALTADTWTKITKIIVGNSNLTFNNDNGEGVQINISPFWGTDNTGSVSLNAWAAYSGSTRTPDNTTTWYTTNDATLEITGVQLEVGSVATDFEHRSFAQELALCQRYFNAYSTETVNGHWFLAAGYNSSNAGARGSFPFTVPMRAIPSLALSDLSHFIELGTSKTISSITLADSGTGKNLTGLTVTFSTNATAGFAYVIRSNSTSAVIKFDAEL